MKHIILETFLDTIKLIPFLLMYYCILCLLESNYTIFFSGLCAFFFINGKRVKVIDSRVGGKCNGVAGAVVGNTDELVIACGDGTSLRLITVQPEGSKPMHSGQMLKGHPIELGTVVG